MSASEAVSAASVSTATKSIFDDMFQHCHMDNPVYVQGMFWIGVFILTYIGTLYYKCKEKREAEEAEIKKLNEMRAKARDRQTPLIQPLAKPIEKRIEVPVVQVEKKAKKVAKDSPQKKKSEPVQMVEQTPSISLQAQSPRKPEEKLVREVDVPIQPTPKKR